MTFSWQWTRRTLMGSLGAIAGTMLSPRKLFGGASASAGRGAEKMSGFGETGNVYEELACPR